MKKTERKASLGEQLIEGLSELAEALESGARLETRLTVRRVKLNSKALEPQRYTPSSVRKTRAQLGVSQAIFAQMLGVSTKLVQAWEQGTRTPEPIARHVLDDVNREPKWWLARLRSASSPATRRRKSTRHQSFARA